MKDQNGMIGVKEDKRLATVFYILNFRSGKYYFNQEKVRECLWRFATMETEKKMQMVDLI